MTTPAEHVIAGVLHDDRREGYDPVSLARRIVDVLLDEGYHVIGNPRLVVEDIPHGQGQIRRLTGLVDRDVVSAACAVSRAEIVATDGAVTEWLDRRIAGEYLDGVASMIGVAR